MTRKTIMLARSLSLARSLAPSSRMQIAATIYSSLSLSLSIFSTSSSSSSSLGVKVSLVPHPSVRPSVGLEPFGYGGWRQTMEQGPLFREGRVMRVASGKLFSFAFYQINSPLVDSCCRLLSPSSCRSFVRSFVLSPG